MKHVLVSIMLMIHEAAMLGAAVEDQKWKKVRRFYWWIAVGAGMAALGLRQEQPWMYLGDLAFFGIIQYGVFSKIYGRADCHAFFCGSIALAAMGGGLKDYLLMALVAFGILAGVQTVKRNVDRKGNLREAVAFVPYIVLAYGISLLLLAFRCDEILVSMKFWYM